MESKPMGNTPERQGTYMKQYKPSLSTFVIEDGNKQIMLDMEAEQYIGYHIDDNGKRISEYDRNQIECSYKEADEECWGVGCNEFFSTSDLKNMADGIRSVIHCQTDTFTYSSQDDFFHIALQYDCKDESYSFTAAILDTLVRESYVTITKNNLSYAQLEEYIQSFFEWEKQFPIV